YRVARSTVYAAVRPTPTPGPARKPGPKTRHSDGEIIEAIRAILAACPFHGEGYRKVRARLGHRGLHLGGKRVLRLMRAHGLLAPRRLGPPNGNPAHDGTIITDRPDVMWGTDATRSTPNRTAGAGSSARLITISTKSSAGTRRSSAIAGRRSSPFARASAMPSDASAKRWRGAWRSAATGVRSTSPTPGSMR